MAVKKAATKKSDLEKKFDDVKHTTEKTAKKVEIESKKIASWVGSWWSKANDEEKIYMVLWIILLIIGLYVLRNIVGWLILIIVWILFVTWFFAKKARK